MFDPDLTGLIHIVSFPVLYEATMPAKLRFPSSQTISVIFLFLLNYFGMYLLRHLI
jgi:hypothetical protein